MSGAWTLAVDFGTTSTVTAMCDDTGSPEILEVDGNRKMPSMVVVDNDHTIVVGIAAAGLARSMPQRTIRTPKNRLGDAVPIVVGGTPFQPVAFVTSVLKHVLDDATRFQGQPPTRTRLTYPATWNRPKRSRLLEAAVKAGYPEPELVAEPIAAALTYADATDLKVGDHVGVFDLGGGTFDTVVLRRTDSGFAVVGRPLGDPQLGGELFDEILMNYVGEQIDQAMWDQLLVSDEADWMRAAARLRAECKRAKEALSSHPVAEVSVGLPGGAVDVSITRDELDELIIPFIDEAIELLNTCMSDASNSGDTIDAIYVTGGASRMPVVEQRVRDAYPNTVVSRRGDPKVAVALGALLAVPGSLDESLQQSPERTTVEEGDETNASSGPAPQPPTIAVPVGPETHVHEGGSSASSADLATDVASPQQLVTPPVVSPPVAPVPLASPPAQSAPLLHSPPAQPQQPVTLHGALPPADFSALPGASDSRGDNGISLAIVAASVIAVFVLVGGVAALALTRGGGEGDEPTPDTVVAEADVDAPETTAPDATVAVTVVEETVPDAVDSGDSISEDAFRAVGLSASELGFGWVVHPAGIDTVNRNLCGLEGPAPLVSELATFGRTEGLPPQQLTTQVQLFDNDAGAQELIDFAASLETQCPTPEQQFSATSVITAEVVPLDYAMPDGQPGELDIPAFVDDSNTLVYRQSRDEQASFNGHLIVVDLRVGRATGTIVQHTAGQPNLGHRNLMNSVIDTMSSKLLAVQQ